MLLRYTTSELLFNKRIGYKIAVIICLVLFSNKSSLSQKINSSVEIEVEKTSDKLLNPMSDLWSLQFQNNFIFLDGNATDGDREANAVLFQPVTPIPVGNNWNLVNRTIFQFISSEIPIFNPASKSIEWEREAGLGDLKVLQLLAPNTQRGSFFGVGWNWVVPIAGNMNLGEGKWQVGPAVAFGSVAKNFAGGILFQQAWSIGGEEKRTEISRASLQYFIQYRISRTFNLGMSPLIVADWKAESENRWQVPIGFGFSTLVFIGKLPVKFGVELQHYLVKPKSFGPKWSFQFNITPVIPNIFKDIQI